MSPRRGLYRVGRAATPGLAFGAGLIALKLGGPRPAPFAWVLIPLVFGLVQLTLKPRD